MSRFNKENKVLMERLVESGRKMGLSNRKNEHCMIHPDLPHYAKGYCRNCYARNLRNGTPDKRAKIVHEKPDIFNKKRLYVLETCTPKDDKERKVLELLAQGMVYEEIGKELGCTKQRIGQMIKNMKERSKDE